MLAIWAVAAAPVAHPVECGWLCPLTIGAGRAPYLGVPRQQKVAVIWRVLDDRGNDGGHDCGNRFNGIVVDTYIAKHNLRGLYIICLVLAGMYVVSSAFTYWQNYTMIDVAQDTSARIRHDIFAKLQRLPMRYFDTHDNGDVMSTLTNDVDNINTALMQTFVQLFTGIISVVGMLGAMIVLSPLLTVIVLLSTVMTYTFSRMAARVTQKAFTIQQSALGDLNSQIEESVSGKRAVQLFNHEQMSLDRFAQTNTQYTAAAYRAQLFSGAMGPFNNMTNNVAYLLITAAGAISIVSGRGGITVGVIFTFLIYLRNFTGPINNTLNLINTLQLSLASAERVFKVIDEEPERDLPDAEAITTTTGAVSFDHVSFAYEPGKEILHDVNIEAHPGDTVAIVGPTGAGKTTMMNLLTNLYPLQSGTVRWMDGMSPRLSAKTYGDWSPWCNRNHTCSPPAWRITFAMVAWMRRMTKCTPQRSRPTRITLFASYPMVTTPY